MNKFLTSFLGLVLTFSCTLSVQSADANGKFAVKGAGKRLCSDFVKTAEAKTRDYYLYGGWLEGYLSSYNRFQEGNYDITPWQSTELMLALLQRYCQQNSDTHFMTATNSLIMTLFPIRLEETSELVSIEVQNKQSYFYSTILVRAKERLKALGFLKGEVTNEFVDDDLNAFSAFQESLGIQVTGVPDQQTLMALFLKPKSE